MKKVIAALTLLAGAVSAQAGIVKSDLFNNPLAATEIAQSGHLAKYDGAIPLNKVTLTLFGQHQTLLTLFNPDQKKARIVDGLSKSTLNFASTSAGINSLLANQSLDITFTPGPQLVAAGGSQSFAGSGAANLVLTFTGAALNEFIGNGTFELDASSLTGFATAANGGWGGGWVENTYASFGARVDYSVPEPDTLALTGLLLVGLGVAARRRKA